jgi:signal transduction histidine kinase
MLRHVAVDHLGPRSLRHLLDTVLAISSELDLEVALRRIVQAAASLVDARYGALGVLDESRSGLSEFITVGIEHETHRAIGSLPKGLGLLGSLIVDARPLRVPVLDEHPDRAGFPPNHPSMTSFLGVPIVVRGEVFGNLYLTDKATAEVFSDLDEQLTLGLAAAAGVVIDNARLYGQVHRREAALNAIHEVIAFSAGGHAGLSALQLIADHALELVGADLATFARPGREPNELVMDVVSGADASALAGQVFSAPGSVSGEVMLTGTPVVMTDASHDHRVQQPQVRGGHIGPAIWVALTAFGRRVGTLSVARRAGSAPFTDAELELVLLFAAQAGVIVELDQSREDQVRLSMLEDQERIARDLHDTVIQRLFATGLSLQSASRLARDDTLHRRITSAVDELDATIRHIRTVIFGLERPMGDTPVNLRSRTLELCAEAARALGFEPRVLFDGPLDTAVPPSAADEMLAVLREALSNVSRHASARSVSVEVAVESFRLTLVITDDGVGITGTGGGGHGLANMRARAADLGGTFLVESRPGGGVCVSWAVPLTVG